MKMHDSAMSLIRIVFLSHMLMSVSLATDWKRCYNTGNFTASSFYHRKLNLLLSSLASNVVLNDGFYHTTIGQDPDKVYGLALCRADDSVEMCGRCVNFTAQEIMTACPSQKEAFMWRAIPQCIVHYAEHSFFGKTDVGSPVNVYFIGKTLTSNLAEFDRIWKPLMDSTTREASMGSSRLKFATQEANLTSIQTIYALMQCTPDLSESDCNLCLTRLVSRYIQRYHGRQGAGVWSANCILHWDFTPFYEDVVIVAPPPASSATTKVYAGEEGNGIASKTVVSIIICMVLVGLACFFLGRWKQLQIRSNQKRKSSPSVKDMKYTESLQFDIGTIRAATENFSEANKLGEGGFGVVYKGMLSDGQQIAVKRLFMNSKQEDVDFKNEVVLVARLQHRNLVRLLGFCLDKKERILVYEFLPNSSLDHFIFDPTKREGLDWERRYKIIQGIARGLLYLHEDSILRVIHRDLKASNILLDSEMLPKISDFGTARLFDMDQTHISTNRVMGTLGYMAPEYVVHQHFSIKTDVFSFGVLVLEIMSGQKRSCFSTKEELECLLSYAWKRWNEGTTLKLIDPTLKEGSRNEMMKCIYIGLLCVQENVYNRPTMASVIHMLNSESVTLTTPTKPGFFIQSLAANDQCIISI